MWSFKITGLVWELKYSILKSIKKFFAERSDNRIKNAPEGNTERGKLPQGKPMSIDRKPILISRQASEHFNLDYRVKNKMSPCIVQPGTVR
jgi:hypothetical protein